MTDEASSPSDEAEGVAALLYLSAEAGVGDTEDAARERWRAASPHERATVLHAVEVLRGKAGPLNAPPPPPHPEFPLDDLSKLPPHAREKVEKEPGPKLRAFNAEIGDLLTRLRAICVEHEINYGVFLELDVLDVSETEKLAQMIVHGRIDGAVSPQMRRVARLIKQLSSDEPPPIDRLLRLLGS